MKFTFRTHDPHDLTFECPAHYRNQRILHCEYGRYFDGYSQSFRGQIPEILGKACFTVSLRFLPLTFSAHTDGLICCYDQDTRQGLELLLGKGGVLTVRFGNGRMAEEFTSCNAHVLPGVQNVVTVVYRGDTGWCDLLVNGVFSNRKQFDRNTLLAIPERPFLLGRRQDSCDIPFGHYYGFLDWVSFDEGAAWPEEVYALHREFFTGKQEEEAVRLGMATRSAYHDDPHRPKYHLCPPGKWMNEPHGPVYYGGFYHIFYQANPHAPIWDHIAWGHLYSRDMVRWIDAPLALTPESCPDAPTGIWSGSSVLGKDGVPRIYFTAGDNGAFPNQAVGLAVPADPDDGRLLNWVQHPGILQKQNIGWLGEYRDPFVWLENDTYFMLVGTGDEHYGAGNAALYTSDDGISWQSHGMLLDYEFQRNSIVGHVWELPVLLPLKDETGKTACHILLMCACRVDNDLVETPYFLGRWDPEAKTFTKFHEQARLLDLGKGYFTGPSGFVTPDGRTVLFTIAQGRQGFRGDLISGWAHNGGIPVELSYRDGDACIRPIRELESLRKMLLTENPGDLPNHTGNMLCLELTADGNEAWVSLCDKLTVRCDRTAKRLEVLDENGRFIGRYRGEIDNLDIGDEPIRFTCYLDHSMLEIYVNDRKSVTLRNYFSGNRFFRTGGDIQRLQLWEMGPAYQED